jgi:hypothetical protein
LSGTPDKGATPVLPALFPQLNLLSSPRTKFLGTPLSVTVCIQNSWVRHCLLLSVYNIPGYATVCYYLYKIPGYATVCYCLYTTFLGTPLSVTVCIKHSWVRQSVYKISGYASLLLSVYKIPGYASLLLSVYKIPGYATVCYCLYTKFQGMLLSVYNIPGYATVC